MPHISIAHITKHYSGHTALNDVSMEISAGSIFGLLGPNGSGKTSLMRILNRITFPDRGHVKIDSELLGDHHIRKMGYLPEERGLYRKMRVAEQIRFLARLKGMRKADAAKATDEWLDKFGLAEWRNRRIETLSKGMAQKVQFIATVIHKPALLVMDEPFSGFDPVNAALMKDELLAMKQAGTTIILSTHDMGSVETLCDDIGLIHKGKLVLSGKVTDIRQQFNEGLYEVEFKGNLIAFTNALWAGFELVSRKQLGNEHFVAYLKMLQGNDLNAVAKVTMDYVKIQRLQPVLPTMNDIFLKAVQPETKPEVHA
jgi:ABC-2 type transport system ATP-binding protein